MISAAVVNMPLGTIASAVKALYNMGEMVNDYIDDHISNLKRSDNPTIASTGRVLEAAKFGFGLGYLSSIAIIATGQLLLGNTLSAVTFVASAASLTNPIAMTCAAVGAIYYGWSALSENERSAILERLTLGLQMGVEIIKSLIDFVVLRVKNFSSSKQLSEFKVFVKNQSEQFGKSLFDITHAVGDLVKGAAEKLTDLAGHAVEITNSVSRTAADVASDAAGRASESVYDAAKSIGDRLRGSDK